MGLKAFILLILVLAIFAIVTSDVAARELAESSTTTMENTKKSEKKNEVNDAKYPGGGYGGYPGGGRGHGRGGYGGGYCSYGCCERNYYGNGCNRCCYSKSEAVNKVTQAKPHN
ncbi:hypothetical protein AABB24_036474 [Solanum stoloniferum]|uniref:Glycine-rich protein n=1 Tax=Solanum stoloniferum TaxID=62892 RepID=A0ABD2RC96_9SOLN